MYFARSSRRLTFCPPWRPLQQSSSRRRSLLATGRARTLPSRATHEEKSCRRAPRILFWRLYHLNPFAPPSPHSLVHSFTRLFSSFPACFHPFAHFVPFRIPFRYIHVSTIVLLSTRLCLSMARSLSHFFQLPPLLTVQRRSDLVEPQLRVSAHGLRTSFAAQFGFANRLAFVALGFSPSLITRTSWFLSSPPGWHTRMRDDGGEPKPITALRSAGGADRGRFDGAGSRTSFATKFSSHSQQHRGKCLGRHKPFLQYIQDMTLLCRT